MPDNSERVSGRKCVGNFNSAVMIFSYISCGVVHCRSAVNSRSVRANFCTMQAEECTLMIRMRPNSDAGLVVFLYGRSPQHLYRKTEVTPPSFHTAAYPVTTCSSRNLRCWTIRRAGCSSNKRDKDANGDSNSPIYSFAVTGIFQNLRRWDA